MIEILFRIYCTNMLWCWKCHCQMCCFLLACLFLFSSVLKIQELVESWPKKPKTSFKWSQSVSFPDSGKLIPVVLSIADSGKVFLLERDCSEFSSIMCLFSAYASLIVVLLTRLPVFVETFIIVFFFKLGIQILNPQTYRFGDTMKYLCCYPVFLHFFLWNLFKLNTELLIWTQCRKLLVDWRVL